MRYETARAKVSDLNHKRKSLVNMCAGIDTTEDHHGMIVEIGSNCFVGAWDYMVNHNQGESYEDQIDYDDAFIIYMNDDNGACPSCQQAYRLKHGELAEARKEFGNAKRALSRLGKKLIGEENEQK